MNMTRVVVIAIDGLDADLLHVYGPSLPHMRRLMLESPFLELHSTFPPLAATAWASVYTGLNPANHGVLSQQTCRASSDATVKPHMEYVEDKTFWARASRAGKRVCIVNPSLSPPAESINGVLVLPQEDTSIWKAGSRQLKTLFYNLQASTSQQAQRALELCRHEPWDIFFLQLPALDMAEHIFWRYSDPGDPTYPGRNEFAGVILDFYRLFDQVVGRFLSLLEEDCVLFVLSGHGHGRRFTQYFHLNEWLRSQGLLTPRAKTLRLGSRSRYDAPPRQKPEVLFRQLREQHHIPHLQREGNPGASCAPGGHGMGIDSAGTLAEAVALGIASPFGGVRLNRVAIEQKGKAFEQVREDVVQRLSQLRLAGRPVVNWADRRERVYQGTFSEDYPDILLELRREFGLGSSLFVPLLTPDGAHHLISGEHRLSGVLLVSNVPHSFNIGEHARAPEPTVMDVAPTILQLIGVEHSACDGRALIQHAALMPRI